MDDSQIQVTEQVRDDPGSPAPRLLGSARELRAMKRALVSAPLGPKAVLALTSAIIEIERDLHAKTNAEG